MIHLEFGPHDHLVHLPPHWVYLNQFKPSSYAPHPSEYRCVEASGAMAAEFGYINPVNAEQVEHDFYQKFVGADVSTDTNGTTKPELIKWFQENHIAYIDMQDIVNSGDTELLRKEISAQNRAGVLQLISIADESHLRYAPGANPAWPDGQKLHAWNDKNMGHCFVRLGYSDDMGWGYYAEPAAAGFSYDDKGNWQPVPISWSDIVAGKITSAIAVLPAGVPQPPANFRYYRADNLPDNVWPIPPKPAITMDDLAKSLQAFKQASDDNFTKLIAELQQVK